MTKKVLIPFTGGFDSTCLICMAIEQGIKFDVFHHQLLNNQSLTELEDKARASLTEEFRKITNHNKATSFGVVNGSDVRIFTSRDAWVVQPVLWVTLTALIASEYDEVWLGYKGGDTALSFINDIRQMWDNAFAFRAKPTSELRKYPHLKFPLMKMFRGDIIEFLYRFEHRYEVSLVEHIVTCETGTKYCECNSCETLKTSNKRLYDKFRKRDFGDIKEPYLELFKAVTDGESMINKLQFKVHRDELV
jgi:7-cyano-7-deazaguanine synthase in queuosine biosynthesis